MTNGTNLTTANHLETASVNAKRYILAELLTLTNAITTELNLKADDEVFSAGASGIVPAPTAGDANNFLRGDGQWVTPTVSIGTTSSTIDGGLWFEFKDGLPIVKMNYNGATFALGAKPTDGALIGDKLYLGGHEFKLTGFASGLTFSDNKFYVAGNLVGSVSNFAFKFTNAAALSVAEGGTISITQLDTDVVDFSLDLGFLNVNPLPAPTVIRIFVTPGHDYPDDVGAFEFTDAAATWTGALTLPCFGFVTNSTGNLNVTGTPANAAAVVSKFTDPEDWIRGIGYFNVSDLPDIVKNVQNPVYWIVFLSLPDYSSADCLGDFTCVFNATDTYSSATVHVNVTGISGL